MDNTLLVFNDHRLEREYQAHYRRATTDGIDVPFVLFNCTSAAVHYAAQHLGISQFLRQGSSLAVAYINVGMLNSGVLLFAKRDWIHSHRSLITLSFRILYHAITVLGIPLWVLSAAEPPGAVSVIKQVFLGSGALLGFWFALGMPMLFRHSLLLAALETAACVALLCRPVCMCVMDAEGGALAISTIWNTMDKASRATISVYFQGNAPLIFPSSHDPCIPTVMFLQVVLGALGPLTVLYLLEHRSRVMFAAARQVLHSPRRRARDASTSDRDGAGRVGYWPVCNGLLVTILCGVLILTVLWELCNTAGMVLTSVAGAHRGEGSKEG